MKNSDEREEGNPPLSILQRLDRLEHMLVFLEEKQRCSAAHASVTVDECLKPEEQCKSMFSALEEVHLKGTLLERIALLENRIIQLSIDMDLGNTSSSSSSTSAIPEKLGPDRHMNMDTTVEEKQDPPVTQDSIVVDACSLNSPSCRPHKRQIKSMPKVGYYYRKWLKWLKLGC